MRRGSAGEGVPHALARRIASNNARNTLARRGVRGLMREALRGALAALVADLLRLLGATWRVEVLGHDPRTGSTGPHLAALLHQSLLIATWLFRDSGYGVAVSRSRDGSRVAAVLRRLGYGEPARGSSSRGGPAALRGLVRRLAAGTTVAVLVDGPRGPAGVAKVGIATLARHCTTPIHPVALAARPALRLGSWDRSVIPLPFARVVCAFGDPIAPPDRDAWGDDEAVAEEVGARLEALRRAAESRLAGEGRHPSDGSTRGRPVGRPPA